MNDRELIDSIKNHNYGHLKTLIEKARSEGKLEELSLQIVDMVFFNETQSETIQLLFNEIFNTSIKEPTEFPYEVSTITISDEGGIERGHPIALKEGQQIYKGSDLTRQALDWVKQRVNQEISRDEDTTQSYLLRESLLKVQSVIKLAAGDNTGFIELSQCREIDEVTSLTLNRFHEGSFLAFIDNRSVSPQGNPLIIKCERSKHLEASFKSLNINFN